MAHQISLLLNIHTINQ